MPTFEVTRRFERDLGNLGDDEVERFKAVVAEKFVPALMDDPPYEFPHGVRVKGVKGAPGVFEMRWAPDGRATFQYGEPVNSGQPHVIWRRIGSHDIYEDP